MKKLFISSFEDTIKYIFFSCFLGVPFLIFWFIYQSEWLDNHWRFVFSALVFLLVYLSVLSMSFYNYKSNDINLSLSKLQEHESILQERESNLCDREIAFNNYVEEINRIMDQNQQTFPYLCRLYADYNFIIDNELAKHLAHKKNPAIKAAQQVSIIAKEKRELILKNKALEYQLNFYENTFPWLEDFKEIPVTEVVDMMVENENSDEYESVKAWLSPQEYYSLSDIQKWQMALDRYINKPKSNWQIGIMYERYVGYQYELKGYSVKYQGATQGVEDRGCDLICTKGNEKLVVQCKNWSQNKTLHEKHILQLFGTTAAFNMELPNVTSKYLGVFVTTTEVSDIAKYYASLLDITIVENYKLEPHPLIKCHISAQGEKIYHLPFDQQYDRIVMELDKGDLYAYSVAQAEEKGFRHAWRWRGN